MHNQRIRCNVTICKHNNAQDMDCDLSSITVVNDPQTPTAHYCEQYEKKPF